MAGKKNQTGFDTILAATLAHTPLKPDGGIDLNQLANNLCGKYTIEGGRITKHNANETEKPNTK